MKKSLVVLFCTNCKRHYRRNDKVVLDTMNSILHESCYKELTKFPIRDRGTYSEIVNRYEFFEDFR